MRAAFGLVSLLVVLLIIMLLWRTVEYPELKAGQTATNQAQQISGRDDNGVAAMNSFKSEEVDNGNQFSAIKITNVLQGGPMDTYYGLKPGDIVKRVGDLDVTSVGDFGSANAMLQEAYQNSQSLVVSRNGVQITLPQPSTPQAPNPINITPSQPPPNSQAPANNRQQPPNDGLPDQLHHIMIPGGL